MYPERQEVIPVTPLDLREQVLHRHAGRYRLAAISCTALKSNEYQVDYAFDRDLEYASLRVIVPVADAKLPSISDIYLASLTYENELMSLFGIQFPGLKINYQGKFYRTATATPFAPAPAAPAPVAPAGEGKGS